MISCTIRKNNDCDRGRALLVHTLYINRSVVDTITQNRFTMFTFFSAYPSKLTFDLHFCIMTSLSDIRNPPFYWIIS